MSTDNSEVFTKENLDIYFKALSREYKRLGGRKFPVEIVLIGGAAIIESYGFREMTTDIDAILPSVAIMKDAINIVGDRYGLPNGWLNADFTHTDSYSRRIREFSKPYRTFNQVLQVRIVTGEYLVAMKLRSGRKYKNDLSDIVGILAEHEKRGTPLTYAQIDGAVTNLYGGWDGFSKDAVTFLRDILAVADLAGVYEKIRDGESQAKSILLRFEEDYPGVMRKDNVDSILQHRAGTEQRASVLDQLNALRTRQRNVETPHTRKPDLEKEER